MHGISILSSCVLIPRIIYSNDLLRAQNNQDSLFFHQLSFLYLIFRVFLYVHIKAIVSPLLCSNTCQTLLFSLKRLMTFFDGGNSLSKFRQTICSYLVFITDYCLFIEITGGHKFFEREKKYKIKSVNKLSWEKTLCEIRARNRTRKTWISWILKSKFWTKFISQWLIDERLTCI